jgi:hypothetical protein
LGGEDNGWRGSLGALGQLGLAVAQVLTAPEADSHPLEVSDTLCIEGENLRQPSCTTAVTLGVIQYSREWPSAAPQGCLPTYLVLISFCSLRLGGTRGRGSQIGLTWAEHRSSLGLQSGVGMATSVFPNGLLPAFPNPKWFLSCHSWLASPVLGSPSSSFQTATT